MSNYKIVVTGPFNSGKTAFIKTISEIKVISTERKITTEDRGIKAETTVAMDYGRVTLDGDTLFLYGTPGQTRFDFMWEILSSEMDAFIMLIDSTDQPSFPEAATIIKQFQGYVNVPYIIVANKTDLDDAADPDTVRHGARASEDIPVMAGMATVKSSVRQILRLMIDVLKREGAAN